MKKYILIIVILVMVGCSHSYYGIDNFGKLVLNKDGTYNYVFHDVGIDTGRYQILEDTLWMTSNNQPVTLIPVDSVLPDLSNTIQIRMRIFDIYGSQLEKGQSDFSDTLILLDANCRIFIQNLQLSAGQRIQFDFLHPYNYLASTDTIINGCFELDDLWGKHVYFNHFPFLMKHKYLLPCDRESIELFNQFNTLELLPLKKGKKKRKFEVFFSGFGHIH